ncbi:MAG: hypothetical protein ACXQTP_00745 [Candidatus Methanofastidiosia archaeon]
MPIDTILESYKNYQVQIDSSKSIAIPKTKCIICKGRLFCGLSSCPILSNIGVVPKKEIENKNIVYGKTFHILIGWKTFPSVPVGPIVSNEDVNENPKTPESESSLKREEIFDMLSMTYFSYKTAAITQKIADQFREMALSEKPQDIEVEFKKTPKTVMRFSSVETPFGKSGTYKTINTFGDVKIPPRVEKKIDDEINAEQAVALLYKEGFDIEYLSKLYSIGFLGTKKKIIPTRWSKTTVYALCSKFLLKKVKKQRVVTAPHLYYNNFLDNHYVVVLLPQRWEFELLEIWPPDTLWTLGETQCHIAGEHETHTGISSYAIREGGSYYASRLAVAEMLVEKKIQASAIVIRKCEPYSSIPFGSWEIKEGIKNTRLVSKFDTADDALKSACGILEIPKKDIYTKSTILNQDKLLKWF